MTLQVETAEALCSAFYQMPFTDFLGEKEFGYVVPGHGEQPARYAWFHLGQKPKDMRVTIIRADKAEQVIVKAEWRNYFADGRNPLKGEQTFTIPTYAATQADLGPATQEVVVKVLELYRQVLSEEGVAGRLSDLQESAPEDDEES